MKVCKITASVVKRGNYYIECSVCKKQIRGFIVEDVVNDGQRENWVYDYENGCCYCYDCYKNLLGSGTIKKRNK